MWFMPPRWQGENVRDMQKELAAGGEDPAFDLHVRGGNQGALLDGGKRKGEKRVLWTTTT